MGETKNGDPVRAFESRATWEAWLEREHAQSSGVWLKLAKKGTGIESVSYDEALEIALCFGWIDGQKGSLDERYWLQRFTPRRASSRWSKRNCEMAERLAADGRMRAAGQLEINAARADGRWDAAYPSPSKAEVPADLAAALDERPKAKAFFAALSGANRYAILYRIHEAKKPETRARRIAKFVAMCEEGETLY